MYSKNWSSNFDTNKENCNSNIMNWNVRSASKDGQVSIDSSNCVYQNSDLDNYDNINDIDDPRVKRSNVRRGFSVTYLEFDSLACIPQNVDLFHVFEEIKIGFESSDWLQHFNAINTLRSLNKTYPHEVNSIFEAFGGYILTAINSPKPCLNKNILGFIYEVLLQTKQSNINIMIILKFVDILIHKLNTINSWLKSLAESCMNTLLENCLCDQIIVSVCELAVDRNRTISKIAFQYIGAIISILQDKISELHPDTLRTLFVTIAVNLESESVNSKILAKHICQYFHILMKQNYENYVMFLFDNGTLNTSQTNNFANIIKPVQPRQSVVAEIAAGKKSKLPLKNCKIEFWGVNMTEF